MRGFAEAGWKNEAERPDYIQVNKLRFLRPYQLRAIHALQRAVKEDKDRFLFEMATGTGKTLTAAAIIKLFLRSGNARRILFLVDRLELEDQAKKAFTALLAADYKTVIFKENRDDWRHAEIVVSTVQSFLFNNKYQQLFSPSEWTGKYDGKDYPVTGDPNSDARSLTKIDDRTLGFNVKKGGKTTTSGRIVVAPDGKSRTVTTSGTDARGNKISSSAVYDKQ